MKGMTLTFTKQVDGEPDELNNVTHTTTDIDVDDCLVAPIIEPVSVREQQAIDQNREQIRIHLPKTYDGDVSGSDLTYDGKLFHLDSDSVVFMADNTPTRWNRYFRAELVNG